MQQNELVGLLYSFTIYCLGLFGAELYNIFYGFLLQHYSMCKVYFQLVLYIVITVVYWKFK